MPRPPFIGLTGGIGAGKSEALAALRRLGAATVSADALAHEALDAPALRERIAARWGREASPNEGVNRARVAEIVFSDPEELRWLEGELHPLVGARIAEWRDSVPSDVPLAVVEVPLLFETGMEDAFDAVVCVVADDATRERRAGERGTGSLEGRSARQLTQEEKAARATHVIHNDGTIGDLEEELRGLLADLVGANG